jgi:ABC-2 type transport system ATP-binding protein
MQAGTQPVASEWLSPAQTTFGGAAPLLEVSGLSRRFGERVALDQLSFAVGRGEIFGLLGPNGAGKSTTFQILACLLRADSGTVAFQGKVLSLEDPALRVRMGVVFQKSSLDDQLSATENLVLGARLYGLSAKHTAERVQHMLDLIELKDRAHERVAGWSGGMRRRLELARALIHQPSVLLMDEPTQGLDEASFRKFWAHLKALRQTQGLTVLLTTHRPEEAEACDRLAVLDQGRRVALDSPAALAARMGGDVVTVESERPDEVAQVLKQRLSLESTIVDGKVRVEARQGHTLIPRIVECFESGRLVAVNLRKPTLADVFLKITGHSLGEDAPTPRLNAVRGRKRKH